MTIGATYASDLSRVRIVCSGAPSLADYATIERSVDQISWFIVRGGSAVTLTAGGCQLDDYEFVPGMLNYYRARYVDTADPSIVNTGTLGSGNNASVSPGLPASLAENDILLMKAVIRNTAGSPNTPAGWSVLSDLGNFKVFTRAYTAGVTAPTVTFTGGVANADTAARITAVRNADFSIASVVSSNASAQNAAYAGMAAADLKPDMMVVAGWKQSTASSTAITGWDLISNDVPSAGDDMTIFWWKRVTSDDTPAGSVTIGGGSSAISECATLRLTRKPFMSQETATVTPTIDRVWMKNLQQPFLNRTLTPTGFSEEDLPSRSGSFIVANRSKTFAVTEVRGGSEYTLTVKTETDSERDDLKAVLASGDVVLIQLPHDFKRFPGGYFLIKNVRVRNASKTFGTRRYFDLQLEETSAPSFALVGNTVTWQGIINSYATWADLMAANATWQDVMNRIGTPSDVVVP